MKILFSLFLIVDFPYVSAKFEVIYELLWSNQPIFMQCSKNVVLLSHDLHAHVVLVREEISRADHRFGRVTEARNSHQAI